MRRQLQIQNGIIHGEWRGSGGVPVPPDGSWTFLEVTDRPEAQAGMRYDAATDTFSAPLPPPTVLGYYDFIQLFTLAERKALRALAATDADVADTVDLLRAAPAIPLKAAKIGAMLTQLVTAGVLTAARRTAILNA